MKKTLVLTLSAVSLVAVAAFGVKLLLDNSITSKENNENGRSTQTAQPEEEKQTTEQGTSGGAGKYAQFNQAELKNSAYEKHVLFFFAPWCPECQAFKEAINSGEIPEGVQVLEVDFDSSTDLKSTYGVTLQSTFVRVDSTGKLEKKWVGYGKDKSLDTVLTNLR